MLRQLVKLFAVMLGLFFSFQSAVWAESYRCQKQGQVVYQDAPCNGRVLHNDKVSKNTPFYWVAEKDNATLYLLGSIHLGKPEMYPLPLPVMQAFKESKSLVLEVDPRNGMGPEMMQLVIEHGMYPPSESLMDHLSVSEQEALRALAGEMGVPMAMFAQQKPWLAMLTLTIMKMQQEGFKEQYGVELYLMDKLADKPLLELESVREQTMLLASLSDETQRTLLNQSVSMLSESGDYFQRMMNIWRKGDEQALLAMLYEGMQQGSAAQQEFSKILISDRNRRMVERLIKLSNKGGKYFVAVGSAHFIGDEGIVALLKQKGFSVRKQQGS